MLLCTQANSEVCSAQIQLKAAVIKRHHVPNHIKDYFWNSMELKCFFSCGFTTRWVHFFISCFFTHTVRPHGSVACFNGDAPHSLWIGWWRHLYTFIFPQLKTTAILPVSFLKCVFCCLQFSRMMSDDNQDTFKSVSRKPGLQIWTINVSRPFNNIIFLCMGISLVLFVCKT